MAISKIQKRNGAIVDFDTNKIVSAIESAAKSVDLQSDQAFGELTQRVLKELKDKKDQIPHVEEIQDTVEKILIESGLAEIAKSYILYRQARRQQRQSRNVVVEVGRTIDEYLQRKDWRVNANSNQGYSLGGLILNTSGKIIANYWLSHVYPSSIGDAHRNADYHIHDLDMLSGYCAGWSLRQLLEDGFNGVPGKVESNPPKHLASAVSQMVNFLGTVQNEWAGAQAFSSFDTYLAPFVKKYKLELEAKLTESGATFATEEAKKDYINQVTYKYVHQNIQSFVFNLNVPSPLGDSNSFYQYYSRLDLSRRSPRQTPQTRWRVLSIHLR